MYRVLGGRASYSKSALSFNNYITACYIIKLAVCLVIIFRVFTRIQRVATLGGRGKSSCML